MMKLINYISLIFILLPIISRYTFGPLVYFIIILASAITFVLLRKKTPFKIIIAGCIFVLPLEISAGLLTTYSPLYLWGTIIGGLIFLLSLIDVKQIESFMKKIGLNDFNQREEIYTLYYTFGQLERLEKIRMSQSNFYLSSDELIFNVEFMTGENVILRIKYKDINKVFVEQKLSSNDLYFPSIKDFFWPIRAVRKIGKPDNNDYFLVIQTNEDRWIFFEEPKILLKLQKEIFDRLN
jgi:hypothetical protein